MRQNVLLIKVLVSENVRKFPSRTDYSDKSAMLVVARKMVPMKFATVAILRMPPCFAVATTPQSRASVKLAGDFALPLLEIIESD